MSLSDLHIAKHVFQVHGVDEAGTVKSFGGRECCSFFDRLSPYLGLGRCRGSDDESIPGTGKTRPWGALRHQRDDQNGRRSRGLHQASGHCEPQSKAGQHDRTRPNSFRCRNFLAMQAPSTMGNHPTRRLSARYAFKIVATSRKTATSNATMAMAAASSAVASNISSGFGATIGPPQRCER